MTATAKMDALTLIALATLGNSTHKWNQSYTCHLAQGGHSTILTLVTLSSFTRCLRQWYYPLREECMVIYETSCPHVMFLISLN